MIKLPVSSIRPYLNKAILFTARAKIGINAQFACLYIEADKAYVYNGESGIIVSLPFSLPQPTMFFPFDLAQVLNGAGEEQEVTLDFEHGERFGPDGVTKLYKGTCKVTVGSVKLKIMLLDPKMYQKQPEPPTLPLFLIEGLQAKVRNALFTTNSDASLPATMCVAITPKYACATDQRGVWREELSSTESFLVPPVLAEQISRLGVEPTGVGLTPTSISVYYTDSIAYCGRMADEAKFPAVAALFEQKLLVEPDEAVVQYDRESLNEQLGRMLSIEQTEDALTISCKQNVLCIRNCVKSDDEDTKGEVYQEVVSSADFDDVKVQTSLFKSGVERFSKLAVKADGKRLLFQNGTQAFCITRRAPQ